MIEASVICGLKRPVCSIFMCIYDGAVLDNVAFEVEYILFNDRSLTIASARHLAGFTSLFECSIQKIVVDVHQLHR